MGRPKKSKAKKAAAPEELAPPEGTAPWFKVSSTFPALSPA